jgi:hypothetical protein
VKIIHLAKAAVLVLLSGGKRRSTHEAVFIPSRPIADVRPV